MNWGRMVRSRCETLGAATALIVINQIVAAAIDRRDANSDLRTALMCTARLDPLVSCVVADSAFASLPMLVHDLLDEKVGSVLVDACVKSCVGCSAMGVLARAVRHRHVARRWRSSTNAP